MTNSLSSSDLDTALHTSTHHTVTDDRSLRDDAAYLSLLSRKIFHAGFSQKAVDARWPAFETAFYRFDPVSLAEMSLHDLERLKRDRTLIRNRRKITAVLENARQVHRIAATHGSFKAWLRHLHTLPYECRADALVATFEHVGTATAFWFLFEAGLAELHEKPDEVRASGMR